MRHSTSLVRAAALAAGLAFPSCGFVERDPAVAAAEPAPLERRAELPTGISARWVELGDPAGEAVLFLHGYTDTSRSFLPVMRHLAALRPDLRLVALDQRGHGGSALPPDAACRAEPERCFELERFVADALALLEREGIERAHVVGHSLGSVVAQELALAAPERVGKLVLIGTSAKIGGNPLAGEMLRDGLVEGAWKDALVAQGLRFPDDAWARTPLDADPDAARWVAQEWVAEPGADPALLAAIADETLRTPLGTWIGVLRALGEHDARARLADLRAPTLVIWPAADAFFPEEPDQRELREALGSAEARHGTPWAWKRYGRGEPGADLGHNGHWAAPDVLARDVARFLAQGAPTHELVYLAGGDEPRVEVEEEGALVLGSFER